MELGTRLEARFRIGTRLFARWRMPGLFALSVVILAFLIWMHPQGGARTPFPWPTQLPAQSGPPGSGQGAGGTGGNVANVHIPAVPAFCLPTDISCIISSASSWVASQIQAAFQPLADDILKNPADIIYQTPLLTDDTSPQNTVVIGLNTFFVEVVDIAFACMLIVGGYNAILGRHLAMPHSSILEVLPRAVLVAGAVHFNLLFVGLFIAFENALSLAVIHVAAHSMLSNVIAGIFTNPLTGLIAFVLLVVLGIMVIMLLIQMITRIALVAISVALAPLGLGCFLLPQTVRWGRLWLVTLSSSVMVQFIQVTALALGGVFISAMASTSLVRLDQQLALAFLAIGTMGLVLKIPGMLQTWALHPMMDTSGSGGGSGTSSSDMSSITSGGSGPGGGGAAAGDIGASGTVMEGTIVTEESGTLLLLF